MKKHIVIDARIRRASTGRPIARLLEHLQELDSDHRYKKAYYNLYENAKRFNWKKFASQHVEIFTKQLK